MRIFLELWFSQFLEMNTLRNTILSFFVLKFKALAAILKNTQHKNHNSMLANKTKPTIK